MNHIKNVSERLVNSYFDQTIKVMINTVKGIDRSIDKKQIYSIRLLKNQESDYDNFYRKLYSRLHEYKKNDID